MKRYFAALKTYLAESPLEYGDDAHSVLEMLYAHYNEFGGMDTEEIKQDFEELYKRMTGMPIREMDKIIDVEGIKIGIRLEAEQAEE